MSGPAKGISVEEARERVLARCRRLEPEPVRILESLGRVLAHDAVRLLQAQGRSARRLEQGLLEWRTEGNPVEVVA